MVLRPLCTSRHRPVPGYKPDYSPAGWGPSSKERDPPLCLLALQHVDHSLIEELEPRTYRFGYFPAQGDQPHMTDEAQDSPDCFTTDS